MTTDYGTPDPQGRAALAAALHNCAVGIRPCEQPSPCQYRSVHMRDADAILANGAVFLPDGLPTEWVQVGALFDAHATIVALRAALAGLVTLFAPYLEAHDCGEGDEWCMKHLPSPAALRAALAKSQEPK